MHLLNLPTEIVIDIVSKIDPSNIIKTGKFMNQMIHENKNDIAYNKITSLGMKINKLDSYTVYKFYMDNKYELSDISDPSADIIVKASNCDNLAVVKYLVENGADIYNKDYALQEACSNGHLEVVKYLVEQNTKKSKRCEGFSLVSAAKNNHLDVVKYLLEKGVDIHTDNNDALRKASKNNHLEMVKYLVEKGAYIHPNNGALESASKNGHLEVVKYLAENGANIYTNFGALAYACFNGHLEVVKYLVENGADISNIDEHELNIVSLSGHLEVVKYIQSL